MLSASLLPGFTQALSAEEETDINIHFETSEVKALICELRKASEKNWERLRTNPSHHHYTGAKLIIRVFFKNLMGQWCESTISYEIAWLAYKNPPPQKTHNLNENTIPPKEIREGDEFKAVLSSHQTKDNLESAVEESANLLTRILRRCAELNKLPDVDNLAFRVDKQKQGIKCKMLVPCFLQI